MPPRIPPQHQASTLEVRNRRHDRRSSTDNWKRHLRQLVTIALHRTIVLAALLSSESPASSADFCLLLLAKVSSADRTQWKRYRHHRALQTTWSKFSVHSNTHQHNPSKMHFSKLCNIFRRKANVADALEPDRPRNDGSLQLDDASFRGNEEVAEVQNAETPLTLLRNEQNQSTEPSNVDTSALRRSLRDQTSCVPLFWPEGDRTPSAMQFCVPSRSSSSLPASLSSTSIPQHLFCDFSLTIDDGDNSSPGAISRTDSPVRDSKLHGSNTIRCHPAILDNAPPFERWSPPPAVKASSSRAGRDAQETTDLRRQASILEIRSDLLTARLRQTGQDLENMTCARDVTRQMFKECNEVRLQAENRCRAWSRKHRKMCSGLETVLRANNAMEQELSNPERDHTICESREAALQDRIDILLHSRWRGNSYLRRRLIETNDRNNILVGAHYQQGVALDLLQKRNVTLQRNVEDSEQKIATLETQSVMANEAREVDTEALQLAEKEVYQLSERLREAETALRNTSTHLRHVTQEKEKLASLLHYTRK
ncbi:hypothetical protein DOTSEDRAFT_33894 [Dothistroma septosporum NZE10]|uniref:Uncharacterized protein n=1 Tax=Dothistroma septosporum (strain NZE10 / CBS 128990) TaxID=675120 RepID=N1PR10_DOTSN|nr:hypothetical protein DOTSEDRAFT_33894 [Dothistroma septosporum NZE10]